MDLWVLHWLHLTMYSFCFFPDVIKEHTYILKNPVPSPQVQITLENPGLPVMILSHDMAVCRLARVQFGLGLGVLGPYLNLHPEVWFRQVVNTNLNLMFRFGMFISGFKQCSLSKKNQWLLFVCLWSFCWADFSHFQVICTLSQTNKVPRCIHQLTKRQVGLGKWNEVI